VALDCVGGLFHRSGSNSQRLIVCIQKIANVNGVLVIFRHIVLAENVIENVIMENKLELVS
jgi:hypothetical protein